MPRITARPGHPYPLGATWDGEGVNFALFSENATSVDLCLFDRPDQEKETHSIRMGTACMAPTNRSPVTALILTNS